MFTEILYQNQKDNMWRSPTRPELNALVDSAKEPKYQHADTWNELTCIAYCLYPKSTY